MIDFNPVIEDNPNIDINFPTTMHSINFLSEGEKLIGTFFRAAGEEKKPTVIILHGLPGNENNFDIAHAIKRFGYNAIIFHYRGSWGSNGSFSISNAITDVHNAIEYFSSEEVAEKLNIDKDKIILLGHSMGGFLAFLASIKFESIKNIGFLAGFNFGYFANFLLEHPEHMEITMEGLAQGAEILQNTSAEELYNEIMENKDNWNLLNKLQFLKSKNILMIGANFDFVAPLALHHNPLFQGLSNIGCNVEEFIINSGHSFSSSRINLTTEVLNWIKAIKFQ